MFAYGREAVEDRQREGGRLAGAGLGGGEDVPALEHEGDGPFLDGRRLRVALLRDGLQEVGARAPALRIARCVVFSGPGRVGGGHLMWSSGAAPSRSGVGGGDRRTGRSIRDNGRMGSQGTRAIDAAKRAGIAYSVHEYAHDARSSLREGGRGYALEAVEALGIDAGRVFKTIVVSVDGRLGAGRRAGRCRGGPQGRRRRAGRPEGGDRPARRGGEGDGLRAGRDLAAGDAAAAADGRGRLGGGVAHDPRLRRAPRPGDRAGGRGPRGARGGSLAPVARRG